MLMNLAKRISIIRTEVFLLLALTMFSCVKQFEPNLDASVTNKIVISGQLLDVEGYQKIDISVSSPINNPKRNPLEHCDVRLYDNNGKVWQYTEVSDGEYGLWLKSNELDLSKEYHIEVLTPDNQRIVSTPESFYSCPEVDILQFEKETHYNVVTKKEFPGLQFFINLKAKENDSRYYLYQVVETSEYHTKHPIEWWYDGSVHHEVPPDKSKSLCWRTKMIDDIFVLSTAHLSNNEYTKNRLNFTDNQSQRLQHLYSLLIKQLSLSKEAYIYWNQMRINQNQTGALYNNQPFPIKGNLVNVSNPDQRVLGYFMCSQIKEHRFFISPQGIDIIDNTCGKPVELRWGLQEIDPAQYPAYLDGNAFHYFNSLFDTRCVDCRAAGGTTVKPVFWP